MTDSRENPFYVTEPVPKPNVRESDHEQDYLRGFTNGCAGCVFAVLLTFAGMIGGAYATLQFHELFPPEAHNPYQEFEDIVEGGFTGAILGMITSAIICVLLNKGGK